jgi:hypothetical protein
MAAARDFQGAEAAAAEFLDACVQQCFLDVRPLAAALEAAYALCRRICTLVRVRERGKSLHATLSTANSSFQCLLIPAS